MLASHNIKCGAQNLDSMFESAGLIINETAHLKSFPSDSSKTISVLKFGQPFYIIDKQAYVNGRQKLFWYRVTFPDQDIYGWINSKEACKGPIQTIDKDHGICSLQYYVGNQLIFSPREYSAAEKLLWIVLNNCTRTDCLVYDYSYDEATLRPIRTMAMESLAVLYTNMGKYQKAIQFYKRLIAHKESDKDLILASKFALVDIYKDHLKDDSNTLKLCHELIVDFPNEKITQFEHNYWVDIRAAESIFEVITKYNSPLKIQECNRILEESSDPVVNILATKEIVFEYIRIGRSGQAKERILATLKRYPNEVRHYFKTALNYSVLLVSASIESVLAHYGDYDQAMKLICLIKETINDATISDYADYKIAELLDYGKGNKQEVLSQYIGLPDIYIYDGFMLKDVSIGIARNRINLITSFVDEINYVTKDTCIKPGIKSSYLIDIQKGAKATVLYKEQRLAQDNGRSGYWAKIRLEDGTVGWILDHFLKSTKDRPIFSDNRNVDVGWTMEGSNPGRTRSVECKDFDNPKVLKSIYDVGGIEVVFYDVNRDGVLDVIGYSSNGLVAISGIDQKVIWSIECDSGSVPLISDNKVYVVLKIDSEYLCALDAYNGELIWKQEIGTGAYGGKRPAPILNKSTIYAGTRNEGVLALDKETGDLIWKFALMYPISSSLVTNNENIYFTSRPDFYSNDHLFALNTNDGRLVWKFDFLSKSSYGYIEGLALEDGKLYCGGANEYLYCIDASYGEQLWKTRVCKKLGRSYSPAVSSNVVYYNTIQEGLIACNVTSGKLIWKYKYTHPFYGAPTVSNSAVYIRSIDSYVHALSVEGGDPLWKLKTGSNAYGGSFGISISHDQIFIGSTDNNLYIIGENLQ